MPEEKESIKDFYWSDEREPHLERRKQILKKHPEVRKLIGPDIRLAFVTVLLVLIQLLIAIYSSNLSTLYFILAAYFVGATINHSLFLAIHEITHNLAFKKQASNNWLAMIANIPIVFPYAMSFKFYHSMHHRQQGVDGIDVDIPTRGEAKIFTGLMGKTIWAINQIFFYALRPMFVYPLKIKKWQVINIIFQVAVMTVFLYFTGWIGLVYLLLSDFIAGSLHPLAGHFISEHYVFTKGQETYSYYGPLNKLAFNVGYHNEHHDFPSIPGSRLPKLKKLAPEFYDGLYTHKSWVMVLVRFITNPAVNLFSRIKRK